jgi:hypothetical protein
LFNFGNETGVGPSGNVFQLIKARSLHILFDFFTLVSFLIPSFNTGTGISYCELMSYQPTAKTS